MGVKQINTETRRNRQTKKPITKSSIVDIATTLFFKKGYDRTTLKDIASPLGCEVPNLYNYFKSKEHILYQIIKNLHYQILYVIRLWGDAKDIDPAEQLRLVVEASFQVVVNWTEYSRVTVESDLIYLTPQHRKKIFQMREKYTECLRNIICRGIERHQFEVIDEKLAATFIGSIIIRSTLWYSPEGSLSPAQVGNVMYQFILNALKGNSLKISKPLEAEAAPLTQP